MRTEEKTLNNLEIGKSAVITKVGGAGALRQKTVFWQQEQLIGLRCGCFKNGCKFVGKLVS